MRLNLIKKKLSVCIRITVRQVRKDFLKCPKAKTENTIKSVLSASAVSVNYTS